MPRFSEPFALQTAKEASAALILQYRRLALSLPRRRGRSTDTLIPNIEAPPHRRVLPTIWRAPARGTAAHIDPPHSTAPHGAQRRKNRRLLRRPKAHRSVRTGNTVHSFRLRQPPGCGMLLPPTGENLLWDGEGAGRGASFFGGEGRVRGRGGALRRSARHIWR